MTDIVYVCQRGHTGARAQAEVLAEHFDGVQLMFGNPVNLEAPTEPVIVDGNGVAYPTADLAKAIAAFEPEVVLFHIFNRGVLESLPTISTFATTVLRAGMNPTEGLINPDSQKSWGTVMKTAQSFDHVVAPSEGTARDLRCMGIEGDRVTVIPTALDMSQVQRPDPNTPQNAGCLAGRITPLKNQHTLVLAMGGMADIDPTFAGRLLLTGGARPDYQQAVESFAALSGVHNRVEFTGYVDPATEYFPRIGVNCLPSISERMPQSVLEAARAGIPSVVADGAWAADLDESMVTVDHDDPLAWAETLYELLTNDARRVRIARQQQDALVDRFHVDDVIERYVDLFIALLDDTRKFKIPSEVIA